MASSTKFAIVRTSTTGAVIDPISDRPYPVTSPITSPDMTLNEMFEFIDTLNREENPDGVKVELWFRHRGMIQFAPLNGIMADVLTSEYDGSNGGISSGHKRVMVVGQIDKTAGFDKPTAYKPVDGVFTANHTLPPVVLVRENVCGDIITRAYPIDPQKDESYWMAGGAYIASSDSRIREAIGFYGAAALHDRAEF